MVGTAGTHLIVDIWGSPEDRLNDRDFIERTLLAAAKEAKTTILHSFFYKFSPKGVTGVVVIAESHISIHTWPDEGYASIDVYTCGDKCFPQRAVTYILNTLGRETFNLLELERGEKESSDKDPYRRSNEKKTQSTPLGLG